MDIDEYIRTGPIGPVLVAELNHKTGRNYLIDKCAFSIGPTATEPAIFLAINGEPHDAITIGCLPLVLGRRLTPAEALCLAEYARSTS